VATVKRMVAPGFLGETVETTSTTVRLLGNAESPPIHYTTPYTVLPATDADLVRLTWRDDKIINREPVSYRAGRLIVVQPPPPGCKYSLLNTSGSIVIFEKRPGNGTTPPKEPMPKKALESLTIEHGQKWYLNVEVLTTMEEWIWGLRHRRNDGVNFKQDEGQLYDWGELAMHGFDTIDVLVRTDFAFIGEDGKIQSVVYDVATGTKAIDPKVPARAVIETMAGNLSIRGIKEGDQVYHRIFKNA